LPSGANRRTVRPRPSASALSGCYGAIIPISAGRGTDPDHLSLGWCIGDEHEAWRLDPDHLVFGDGTPGGLGDCVERLTKLPMSLFADIAGLFIEDAGRGSLARDEKAA
jgi:hypothetical protein